MGLPRCFPEVFEELKDWAAAQAEREEEEPGIDWEARFAELGR